MSITATYQPAGLWTNPNPHSEVPDGALSVAQNVVIRRPGIVEARPGFQSYDQATTSGQAQDLFEFDGDVLLADLLFPTSSNVWVLEWRSDASIVASPPSFNPGQMFSAQARGNLYLNGVDDVYKLTGSQDTTIVSAGVDGPTVIILTGTTGGTGIDANSAVRYRATITREDANQLIVESPPSSSLIVDNSTGSAIEAQISIYLPPDTIAGDLLRLFKSSERTTGSEPFTELQQTLEVEITAAHVSAGLVAVEDNTPAADVGATIYTAPSRGGVSQSNFRPPACKDLALFKRSVFFANTRRPHQITLEWEAKADRTGFATGIGSRQVTGTSAVGNPTLTAVADTTGIEAGMYWISFGAGGIPTTALVVSTTATTITFDTNAAGSVADSGAAFDVINIDGITYAAAVPQTLTLAVNVGNDGAGVDLNDNGGVPDPNVFATALSGLTGSAPSGAFSATVQLQRKNTADTSFAITATHGSEYIPIIPQIAATALDSEAETRPNGLYWSKENQPEHVPAFNQVDIGTGAPIQRIVTTRDAIWVFKEDGIFRVTGTGAGTWRIDEWDLSHFLVAYKSPAVLDDVVYAWTNRGIIALDGTGVRNISQGPVQDLIQTVQIAVSARSPKDNEEIFGMAAEPNNEYLVTATRSQELMVYNTLTRAWTIWEAPTGTNTAGIYRNATDQYMLASRTSTTIYESRTSDPFAGGIFPGGDEEYSITITVTDLTDVEITANPDSYSPTVGDSIVKFFGEGQFECREIITVTDSTHVVVSPGFGSNAVGSFAFASEPFTVAIEYQWRADRNPGISKNYYVTTWAFDMFSGYLLADYGFSTPLVPAVATQTRTLDGVTVLPASPLELRAYVDIAHARTVQIRPSISLTGSCGAFRHTGIQLVYNIVGEKVAER